MLEFLPQSLSAYAFLTLVFAALLGGLVRGFTGFGFAMVFMPLASVVVSPVFALGLIWFIDLPFALPIAAASAKRAEWREILPLMLTATLTLPTGIWLLTWLDPITMRWLLAALVLLGVGLMASGWRYQGKPTVRLALGVGATSGLFNGMASMGGMPIAVFWLGAQTNDRHKTRANFQAFVGLSAVVAGLILWRKGILSLPALQLAVRLLAVYGIGLWIGTRAFQLASESAFRRVALLVIFLSALISVPIWDAYVGR